MIGWYDRNKTYQCLEIPVDPADEQRIKAKAIGPGDAMATRQLDRGLYQVIVYADGRAADVVISRESRPAFAIDFKFMEALGFRWKRRWCGKVKK